MGTKVNSNYEDLLTFTRASKGHALRPVSYGTELVSSSDQNQSATSTDAIVGVEVDPISVEVGKIYFVSATVTATSTGTFKNADWGIGEPNIDPVQSSTFDLLNEQDAYEDNVETNVYGTVIPNQSTIGVAFRVGGTSSGNNTLTVSNISVKEVTFDQPDGTLTLFEHPENIPRVEYDADGNRLGLLVEEQRVNLVAYSEDFTDASWNKSTGTTVTSSTTVAPNGVAGCSRVQFTAGSRAGRYVQNALSPSPLASATHTISVWVKSTSGTNQTFSLKCTHGGVADYFSSDFTATSEWQRFDFSQAFGAGGTSAIAGVVADSSGNAADLEVWGFQFEGDASFPTSYMKNEGTASGAIRSADVASIPVADFGYNQSAGTFFIDITDVISNNNKDYFSVSSSGSFNPESFGLYGTPDTGSTLGYRRRNSAYDPAITSTADIQSTGSKVALSHDASSLVISVDGVATETSSSNSVDTITEIAFGGSGHGVTGDVHSKHIKSIKYYPRRLTNAQLVELTS